MLVEVIASQSSVVFLRLSVDMSQLRWLQRNGRRRVDHNDGTDLGIFWVKGHGKYVNTWGLIVD